MQIGSAWDFLGVPVKNFTAQGSPTAPVSPVVGQLWTDTSVSPAKVRWFNGTTWIAADGTSIPNGFITDAHISSSAAINLSKLATDPLARSNHTGTQLASTISDFDTRARSSRLDQLALPTSNIDFNGVRGINVANPVAGSDLANKQYVDNSRAGISVKDPVRVVAQANVTLAAPGSTIDGVSLGVGDRFLAPRQSTGTENGIYVFQGNNTAAVRASDADGSGEVTDGSMVAVGEGTDAGRQYIQTGSAGGAPGTWTQTWVVFTMGGQTYMAGTGLTISGTTFALDAPVPVNLGGTGAVNAAGARSSLGAIGRFATDLGVINAGQTYVLNHSLNSTDVLASFRTTVDGRAILFDWAPSGTNAINVFSDISYSAGAVRAVVLG